MSWIDPESGRSGSTRLAPARCEAMIDALAGPGFDAPSGACETWTTTEVASERLPPRTQYGTTRNILELQNGSLLHFVSAGRDAGAFL